MTDLIPATFAVVLPDGHLEPHWSVDDMNVLNDGSIDLLDNGAVVATYAAGEWRAAGFLTLADSIILTTKSGEQVPPPDWEGYRGKGDR